MANSYQVRLINEEKGIDNVIEVAADEYILDAAERQGFNLPYSCRAGVCVNCTARLTQGTVNHDYDFLKAKEIEAGFFLTCKSFATSNCVVKTHQEDALLDL
ncbi:MAG: 2Fe-2S iron-sulfur cluster binding domain-containing protein [Cyanobacteria bacterium]|uniref:2Fe-2S iron-sulfur cluster-binding protein n=1 Tax=Geminocystis sp. TaxID=2664100 RepID=UPI001D873A32|nr:2Fe-2S iron-sulfur cluster binding domain-containing protein [Cyanobacteria bacterium CG_2015-16_32_12]NCO78094.1 2Fe-2S iron-sulfur cluster binding domain-containing protein [Cyanobacteria bacterium CG_2015-22_32_23]NCQ05122.1 2Fe-2S iron-sulfur cluster binding domain-containing protein [Cyanobacteria bacterium CG_2015-09_32_10]NCQ40640.1 2Fe-2S iron-sulfur cluster binding domain-containing protein [Cyanobacteria bacterium CG_2015-04_32_10]NCS83847.1 2Fe-2S iron-sulfur cluster binding domai